MSGTSLDGLDICYSKFIKTKSNWDFQILRSETIPYSSEWEHALKNAIQLPSEELLKLDVDYGLNANLLHQVLISFRNYIMQSPSLDVDIHIILNVVCFNAVPVDDLFPVF